jgi:hypothetical protein
MKPVVSRFSDLILSPQRRNRRCTRTMNCVFMESPTAPKTALQIQGGVSTSCALGESPSPEIRCREFRPLPASGSLQGRVTQRSIQGRGGRADTAGFFTLPWRVRKRGEVRTSRQLYFYCVIV